VWSAMRSGSVIYDEAIVVSAVHTSSVNTCMFTMA
jgi:hypothetical protein